jgi:hypothetical protein
VLDGVQLTLLIGPAVPLPVPREVLEALVSVQVVSRSDGPSGFQLEFTLAKNSPLQIAFLLAGGGSIPPIVRVLIIVTVNGTPDVLMDGVMTSHEFSPGTGGAPGKLTVTGEDLSRVMDWIDFSGIPYPAMPREARVALVLAKYALLGVVPMVIPSILIDVPLPTERIPLHQGKDLAYVKQLADEVGYTFYVDPGPTPGMSLGYWGPLVKVGVPQPPLNVDMDVHTNVESLGFSFNADAPALPVLIIQEPNSKAPIPIPVPDISPLNPPLGAIPPIPSKIDFITEAAKWSPIQAALVGMAKASQKADAVTGTGTLDVRRYGRPLKARRLVSARGAGTAFDGLYYVSSVTHQLKRGEYKQSFTLARNGLVSTLPQVPV